jgi:hypothetical protein
MTLFARPASFLNPFAGGRSAVRRLALIAALASFASLLAAGPAAAAEPAPWWHLTQRLVPSRIAPEGEGQIVVQAINLGNADTAGKYEISDQLPAGLELTGAEFFARPSEYMERLAGVPDKTRPDLGPNGTFFEYCQQGADGFSCANQPGIAELGPPFCEAIAGETEPPLLPSCTELQPVVPYDLIEMVLKVKAENGFGPGLLHENQLTASGGAAPSAHLERPLALGDPASVPFGLEHFSLRPEAEGGKSATDAGSHPYQLTADVAFNRSDAHNPINAPAPPRNLHFNLPPGQLGNAIATPQCSATDFAHVKEGGSTNQCPSDTVLGAAIVTVAIAPNIGDTPFTVPVFNLEPAPGEPARFGFEVLRNPVILDTHIRSAIAAGKSEDYGVTVDVSNITEVVNFVSATTVFWGAPADPSHNESRGWGCIRNGFYKSGNPELLCEPSNNPKPPAFLTLPSDCAAPFNPLFEGISWPTQAAPGGFEAQPLEYRLADEAGNPLGLVACNQVPFDPQIHAEPTSNAATSPTGLNFDLDFQDEGLTSAAGIAQSQIKRAIVTLPQGFTTNPSVAEGLQACSQAEYEASSPEANGCTPESKVGEVQIESPLLQPDQVVKGGIYVARQKQNPNANLLTLYLIAREPQAGVVVRQALRVEPNPVTGQLTTEVDNVPELPFGHFQLSFRQGQRSPLVTPPACGTYTVQADLYPWSNPSAPVHRESSFEITQGPEGQPCPSGGTPPFHPDLHAGTYSNQAGAYSPFYTRITRRDSEQEITHFSIKLPPGVIGKLAGVSSCSDAQIAAAKALEIEGGGTIEQAHPTCPANSEVGHSLVGSGVGNVLAYAPGKLYLAGPYHGSNISLVSITAARVGPFDLGTVVVRFALRVDPETAEVFVDSTGSDPIPHIVDGIPVHLRDIQAYVDRPDFTLTPTSCAKKSTASTLLGSGLNFASEADDQPVTVSSFFQVANCSSLGFKPKLALSLKGGTKRGATPAFKAVLTYPKGSYANIAKSVVTLPHSEFLEQAHIGTVCTRVQFKEGKTPGEKCPAASIYGRAEAITPLLSEPLKGPVYLRSSSHNLPDLVAALHNNQVDFALDGRIDSVRNGRIRNTFETVPDAPVSKFVLEMQGGKKGLLVNSTNLCKQKNHAISEFTGQNGKLYNTNPVLSAKCGGKGKKKSKAHKGSRAH